MENEPKELPPPQGIRITMVYRKDPIVPLSPQEGAQKEEERKGDEAVGPPCNNDSQQPKNSSHNRDKL